MSYFVTGATGFIGRRLVQELLDHREGDVHVLCRAASLPRLEALRQRWRSDRVVPVVGDLTEPRLGVDPTWVSEHAGSVEHFFHLAAVYDMTADDAANEAMNVEGTRHALELAEALGAGRLHHVSSVAVAGDFVGRFDETMFDEGQRLPSAYHRTKHEAERIVRAEAAVPWRVYRPAIVVGDSATGEMDKVDGPYYFFPLLKTLRDTLPAWLPMVGLDLGATNVVPVDYVASALDHLAHLPGHDGEAFHLVDPEPRPVLEAVNAFCAAAGAPRFVTSVDGPGLLPRVLRPAALLSGVVGNPAVQRLLDPVTSRVGIPAEVLAHTSFTAVLDSRRTERALAGSGISVPDLEGYARTLWTYWEDHLDTSTARDPRIRDALRGKHVVITGASSGIGQVTALKVAQAGGVPVLVARGKDKLEDLRSVIELRGGTAHVHPCDLSDLDAIDDLCAALLSDLPSVDVVVNNAGRSIRRSLRLSEDRFHDFERTMQLNYFGAIRLVTGLLPAMRQQQDGHVVNVSSIGVQTNPPRFSAYVASKSALDSWSDVVASELVGDGITFTTIHMPLVRTPMIAPTRLYDRFPAISPAQAADLVLEAIVERPHRIGTLLGTAGAIAHTVAPRTTFRVLNLAYQVFPDSTAAAAGTGGDGCAATRGSEQMVLARVLKGVHW
ncbi:SDR family oxidoreductase [Nocardioides sp. Arc9.136]|uniref:SDR family oxidoreductase n=1 Tax=Nocardioides sp. Arc9.136 TaxID=2996826 RepID=UPI0026658196|nr:SDR family oxidoreductase [Nocardioides sp. Arc9.136]WKN50197.1 SDR family oxidoreductase [Nocardioides sp. Arc9.136]